MKTVRTLTMVAVLLALMLLVTAVSVAAEEPKESGNPANAPFIDNQIHTIAPNTTLWYRFDYVGNHSQVTIRMIEGADKGLRFEVYTPTQMQSWWSSNPVGAGGAEGADLVWSGNSHEGGTYYVKVINDTAKLLTFHFTIQ